MLGGRGVRPKRSLQLTVRLWGMVVPNGVGTHAGGMGSPIQPVVVAHSTREGDSSPQWCTPTGWGDGESNPTGGRGSRCA